MADKISLAPISSRRNEVVPVEIGLENLGLAKQAAAVDQIALDMTPNNNLLSNSTYNRDYD